MFMEECEINLVMIDQDSNMALFLIQDQKNSEKQWVGYGESLSKFSKFRIQGVILAGLKSDRAVIRTTYVDTVNKLNRL